ETFQRNIAQADCELKRKGPSVLCSALNYPITNYPITKSALLFLRLPGDCHLAEHLAVDRVLSERLVHLVPALLRPVHFLLGRRVPLVLRRVVVVPDAEDLAAGRNVERRLELVLDLPVEVELRHVENRLLAAVGV